MYCRKNYSTKEKCVYAPLASSLLSNSRYHLTYLPRKTRYTLYHHSGDLSVLLTGNICQLEVDLSIQVSSCGKLAPLHLTKKNSAVYTGHRNLFFNEYLSGCPFFLLTDGETTDWKKARTHFSFYYAYSLRIKF